MVLEQLLFLFWLKRNVCGKEVNQIHIVFNVLDCIAQVLCTVTKLGKHAERQVAYGAYKSLELSV